MKRFCLGLAGLVLLPLPSLADGQGQGQEQYCGGDAYSFAEVVPARRGPRSQGPIVVTPDTLCADLARGPGVRIDGLSVYVGPPGSTVEATPQNGFSRRPAIRQGGR